MTSHRLAAVLATGAILATQSLSAAGPAPERPAGFQAGDYRAIHSRSEIPAPVLDLFSSLCGGCRLADFGGPFNATDVIQPDLPRRRLTAAGVSGDRWFLEYEHGGRGLHSHFALFELRSGKATCLWANGPPPTGCRPRAAVQGTCPW